MISVGLLAAFFAGVVSFFAPCVLPLLPIYVSFISGIGLGELKRNPKDYTKVVMGSSLIYVIGFSLVFVLLGVTAGGFGGYLRRHGLEIQKLGGALLILFGIHLSGAVKIPLIARGGLKLPKWINSLKFGRAFLLGVLFGITWTPCIGVVLGSILMMAARSGAWSRGGLLLLFYSFGMSVPFMIVSLSLAGMPRIIKKLTVYADKASMVMGFVMVIIGSLLLWEKLDVFIAWIYALI